MMQRGRINAPCGLVGFAGDGDLMSHIVRRCLCLRALRPVTDTGACGGAGVTRPAAIPSPLVVLLGQAGRAPRRLAEPTRRSRPVRASRSDNDSPRTLGHAACGVIKLHLVKIARSSHRLPARRREYLWKTGRHFPLHSHLSPDVSGVNCPPGAHGDASGPLRIKRCGLDFWHDAKARQAKRFAAAADFASSGGTALFRPVPAMPRSAANLLASIQKDRTP